MSITRRPAGPILFWEMPSNPTGYKCLPGIVNWVSETINYKDALRLVVNATDILRENFVTSAILSLQCR